MSKTYLKRAVPAAQVAKDLAGVKETVTAVIADIREHGDAAVREYSAKFDNWSPEAFRLTPAQVDDIIAGLPGQVIEDITFAQAQVRGFAQAQLASMQAVEVETLPGVFLGHKHLPVSSAGSYIPGGRYPLTASAHMTVLTAKAAGVERVVACTPPIRGEIPAATVAAAHVLPTRGAARYTGGHDAELHRRGGRVRHLVRRRGGGVRVPRRAAPACRGGRGRACGARHAPHARPVRCRHRPVGRHDRAGLR